MLLASLVRLAERKHLAADPAFEQKAVDFVLQIDHQGRFIYAVDRRAPKGSRLVGAPMEIPRLPKRTVGVSSGLLVDNAKYVLGIGDAAKGQERLAECSRSFRQRVEELALEVGSEPGLDGVLAFLRDSSALQEARSIQPEWSGSEVLAFQLAGDSEPVHQRPLVRAAIAARGETGEGSRARCLVTGRIGVVARLHPSLKRVPEGQSSGTTLVSFNGDAFSSHGHSQGSNAPVSEQAAVAYTAAINHMLEGTDTRPYRAGIRLGGSSVLLLWADTDSSFADEVIDALDPPYAPKAERAAKGRRGRSIVAGAADSGAIEAVVNAPWRRLTMPAAGDEQLGLFGLILSGNAARAVVRSSFSSTVADVKEFVRRWFAALALFRFGIDESPTIPMLLRALDPPGEGELPPNLSARLTLAAVMGRPLPADLLRHALLRFRRDAAAELAFSRAAVIKACLVNLSPPRLKESDVSLDEQITDQAYLLGRLFAALERAQENALPGLNATIRDRYFTAASTSPGTVFPRLLRLAQHHVSKAESENRSFGIGRKIQEIVSALPARRFPPLLSLADQGMFAIGYYHQRGAFFVKKDAAREIAQ